MTGTAEIAVGPLDELGDPGCREFTIGEGDWPFTGFVVRQGDEIFAYQNSCAHVGHPLNWMPDAFLSKDRKSIQCASHGALYEIDTGLCVKGPCVGKSLRPVQAEVRNGTVFVTGPTSL
ncbi:MAG TPA: Rieske 2Fe-2S domain-containing protein [Woeseiaceae bacterium]|jgi:nitrite reductase/ring-hydroxylating ferredoxin subunit|nr:Rieske 2Fe-2S domain-containing protein [Woeseiaceae bacterium]